MTDNTLVEEYLSRRDWTRENSNMDYSLQGLNHALSGSSIKKYWLNKIYDSDIGTLHNSGDIHIHDLDMLSVYCVGWDLQEVLISGFRGVPGKMEEAPAKYLSAALMQLVNFLYTLQGESAGAQAVSHLDTLLAPFIRFDNLNRRELKQLLQGFIFNLNVPTRVGFQTPFTNITLDLKVPNILKDSPVVIGGKYLESTYSEYQTEMDLFNEVLIEVFTEGDSMGRVFTFPIPTYNITPDFEWDDPKLEGLWRMTAKYGVPYFANFINSDMSPDDVRSMCCRLRIDNSVLRRRGGGLFGADPQTGSVGVVSINLPRVGYLSKSEEEFVCRLDYLMEASSRSLRLKREKLEELTESGLYPYAKYYLRNIKKSMGKYWGNHFSTIGIIGMNEAITNLFGKDIDISTEKGIEFSVKILNYMREKLVKYQISGELFNLEATPAEGATNRLAAMDKEKYPDIITASSSHVPYYTNSTQLPVEYSGDVFDLLDHQNKLQPLYTGGTVQHIFVGEAVTNPNSVKEFIKTVFNKYHIPYISITPTFSVCPTHGYLSGEHKSCPTCGARCEIYSRPVGFLRPVDLWNNSKQEEYKDRHLFSIDLEQNPVEEKTSEDIRISESIDERLPGKDILNPVFVGV
jgi:ribonucleoside-triphosphate reductase